MFKFIEKLQVKYWSWQYEKADKALEDEWDFIYGLKSYCDLSPAECGLRTMNDFDITYNKKEKKYYIGIETMLFFDNGLQGEQEYIKSLFNTFTKWMISKGYDTNQQPGLYNIFTEGRNIKTGFKTIEELYTCFKLLTNGFISLNN